MYLDITRATRASGKPAFSGYFLLIISILCFISSTLLSAEIKGIVIDNQTGEPLVGANVFIQSSMAGAATDSDGFFFFDYDFTGTATLVVSYVGYKVKTQEISDSENLGNLTIELQKDIFESKEVVVTGIANKRAKDVAEVAVSRIKAEELTEKTNYGSIDQLVNGKIAGVQVRTSSGNVGSGFQFFVRSGGGLNGDGQPVIYIDGIRVDNSEIEGFGAGGQGFSTLADLNPEDIENIEILKGPAAASTYGTDGSNGVVLITTKRGDIKPGAQGGLSLTYKLTTGSTRQSFEYSEDAFVTANDANAVFRDGYQLQHNVNLSGGNNFIKYYASFEDRFQEGNILNSMQDRQNLRANIDVFPTDKFSFSVNTGFTNTFSNRPDNDNNIFGWLGNTLLFSRPYVFTDSAAIAGLKDEWDTDRFIGSFQASYRPTKGLEGRFSVGIDNSNLRQDRTFPKNLDYSFVNNGERNIWNRRNTQLTIDFNVSYNYNLGSRLKATSIVGAQLFDRTTTTNFLTAQNFSTELITDAGAGADFIDKGESKLDTRTAGIFTDHSLSYNDTYFMTLGLRNDYSTSVGLEASSIIYPHISFATRIDRFNILPSFFNLFKLRLAYGETGILPGRVDGIPLLWEAESGGYGAGAVLSAIGNVEIEPERVKEFELGFDTEVFQNYSLEFTYFKQFARESIIEFRNAPSSGQTASAVPINIGEIEGDGIETLLQGSPLRTRNFAISFNLVNSFQNNEVKDLGGAQPIFDPFDVNVTKEGLPNHEFYVQRVLGPIFNENGLYAGAKLSEERESHGNPIPDYTGSFSLNFNLFKNLNFYILTDWARGQKVFNNTYLFATRFGNSPEYNRLRYQLGLVNNPPEGEENLQQFTPGTSEYQTAAERMAKIDWRYDSNFIEDGDYFKIREISVNYSLRGILKRFNYNRYLKDIIVGVSARNIYTKTDYSGADPEVNFDGSRSLVRGQDFLTLQNPEVYNFFVQLAL